MTCVRPVVWMHQASEFPDGERLGSGRTRPSHVPSRHLFLVLTGGRGTGGNALRNQRSSANWDSCSYIRNGRRDWVCLGCPQGAPPEGPAFLPQRQASCLSHWKASGKGVPDPCVRGRKPAGPRLGKATRLSATFLQPCCSWSQPGLPPTDRPAAKACECALPAPPPGSPARAEPAGQLCGPQASSAPSRWKRLREGVPR